MYAEITRPITERERDVLRKRLDRKPQASLTFSLWYLSIWICAAAFVILIWGRADVLLATVIGGSVCLCIMAWLAWYYLHNRKCDRYFRMEIVPNIEETLHIGMVSSKKISATSVVVIRGCEDDDAYIFDVGDSKALLLKGVMYCSCKEDMDVEYVRSSAGKTEYGFRFCSQKVWPNSDFEIVRTIDGKTEIGAFCSGKELTPIQTIDAQECVEEIYWSFEDKLVCEPLDAVLKKLMKPRPEKKL
ncbi:MAG TPA: hypothetical protein VKX17_06325 [Planctomycetota bacterium]|nr:hypothetical protein [Planctomycetota bacterium]